MPSNSVELELKKKDVTAVSYVYRYFFEFDFTDISRTAIKKKVTVRF